MNAGSTDRHRRVGGEKQPNGQQEEQGQRDGLEHDFGTNSGTPSL
jgi:hypothetical protein